MNMNAIRQFVEVKDHSINVILPKDFSAKRVEVIILPNEEEDFYELTQEQKSILDERLLESDEDCISAEDSIAMLRQKYGV